MYTKYYSLMVVISLILLTTNLFALEDREPLTLEVMKIPEILESPTPLYLGLGLAIGTLRVGEGEVDFKHSKEGQDRMGSFSVFAGYDIHKRIACEVRYITSLWRESLANIQSISVLLKPHISLVDELAAYVLLGYGQSTLLGVNKASLDIVETNFQWGLGLEYDTSETVSYFVDYMNLLERVEDITADTLAIGVKYRF